MKHGAHLPPPAGYERGRQDGLPVRSSASRTLEIGFGYLFETQARRAEDRLADGRPTREGLLALGAAMGEMRDSRDSSIPAAYTFLGQFIDHDMTFEVSSDAVSVGVGAVEEALSPDIVVHELDNGRTGTLDLDSVYEGDDVPTHPTDHRLFLLGRVTDKGPRPIGKADDNDVPRHGQHPPAPHTFGEARIADPRNDENVIVSQLQVAFLKFHNAIVMARGCSFEEARRIVRQHYQWIVLRDFLARICDAPTLAGVLERGPRLFPGNRYFMPVEFSVCAYRFGHSMVRDKHKVNGTFLTASLAELFQFVVSPGGIPSDSPTLRQDWIVEWEGLLDQQANAIDTGLTAKLLDLPGLPAPVNNLAVRNLLRGFLLALPTGQAVAAALGVPPLRPDDLLNNARTNQERAALEGPGFHERTPFWYYVLAEASICADGQRLGPVASRIVAETIVRWLQISADSILAEEGWRPSLPSTTAGTFTLADLLRFAGP